MRDVVFIEKEHIFRLHKLAIENYGGAEEVRDEGLIDSAIAQPMQTFGGEYLHATIHEMAAAYFYHISQNQGFSDGNKRTGFLAMFAFLKLNGYDLTIPDDGPCCITENRPFGIRGIKPVITPNPDFT